MDNAQEVQDGLPEVLQLPAHLYRCQHHASRDADQSCALGARLLHL
jgi:hypothetical protein